MNVLEQLRQEIEQIDLVMIEALAKRQELSKKIGDLKLELGLNVVDPVREQKLFILYDKLAIQYNLPKDFVKKFFKYIIDHSKMIQK